MLIIELGGKERNVRFETNELCALEQKAGMGIPKLLSDDMIGFNTLRLLIWAGCRHENMGLTLDMAGLWMQDYLENQGDFEELMKKFSDELANSKALKKLMEKGSQ